MTTLASTHRQTATTSPDPARGKFARLVDELLPKRGPSRLLAWFALAWFASAAVHLTIFIADDTAWTGSVSWRKPIVFSLSIALIIWAYGWVLDRLPHRPRLAWSLAALFAISSTIENSLILTQQWRGRASHFNYDTPGDAIIFGAMGATVALMSALLVALFIWAILRRPEHPAERLAVLAGMALIMSGLGIGQWLVSLGNTFYDTFNAVPETVTNGEAGAPKFPHAIAFHGIQIFMVAAIMIKHAAIDTAAAIRRLWLVVIGYTGLLAAAMSQAILGVGPTDLGSGVGFLLAISLLAISTVLLLVGGLPIIAAWRSAETGPRATLVS
ncbi:MAG: hypothetical protein ACR2QO_03345 [Acidimicrobiales bacterium]